MKTNKGFTLIELLAVIVVLAIIALIAVPIILGVVDKAKVGSAESSVLGYVDAVEKQVVLEITKGNSIENTNYTIDDGSILMTNTKYKGTKVTGTFTLSNNQITSGSFCVNGYSIDYDGKKAKYNKGVNYCNGEVAPGGSIGDNESGGVTYRLGEKSIGDAVYVNPETNEICDLASYTANTNASKTGNKTGCMKWYVYKDNGNGTYQLILDHNTTAGVAWNSSGSNSSMNEVATALTSDTATWDSSLNIDLIDADDIAEITGNTTFSVATTKASNYFFFDTNTTSISTTCNSGNTTGCNYGWLYDRTYTTCKTYGCLNNADSEMSSKYGYWTKNAVPGDSSNVWRVPYNGGLGSQDANDTRFGLRPVITF